MRVGFSSIRIREDEWQRAASIRIRALEDSPEWFSGDLHVENARSERDWRALVEQCYWINFLSDKEDVGMMTVEKADPIRGTDCWVAGCWVVPRLRGRGITSKMVEKLDEISRIEGWSTQGLGVWPDNVVAIRAYERAGFVKIGEPKPSRRKPGQLYQAMVRKL